MDRRMEAFTVSPSLKGGNKYHKLSPYVDYAYMLTLKIIFVIWFHCVYLHYIFLCKKKTRKKHTHTQKLA